MLYTIIPMHIPIITSFVALSGVIITALVAWRNNKKQFQGLVVSQSRINWIQDVRKNAAKYLSHMTNVKISIERIVLLKIENKELSNNIITIPREHYDEGSQETYEIDVDHPGYERENKYYYSGIEKNNNKMNIVLGELSSELDKVKETTQLLRLYLPKQNKEEKINKDHQELQDIMDEIQNVVDRSYNENEKLEVDEFHRNLDNFTNEISSYLKQEWDKAKNNR